MSIKRYVFFSVLSLLFVQDVMSRNLMGEVPPRYVLYDYTMTGNEIILDDKTDTVLAYKTYGEATLCVDLYDGNFTRQRCVLKEEGSEFRISSSLLTGDIDDYRRYKCLGDNSVYIMGHFIYKHEWAEHHFESSRKTVLFKLLPSVPQLEVQLNYPAWDYSIGQPMLSDNLDYLIIRNPDANVYVVKFWDAWENVSQYQWYHTVEKGRDFYIDYMFECQNAFVVVARNEYGDTYSDEIHIEDLITDPDERANMLLHKEDYLTSVFKPNEEDFHLNTDGLYVSVDDADGEECHLTLYGMNGMELVHGTNSLTAPRHGMYVLRIESGGKIRSKKIKL